ncbi:hypothetical protein PUN28_019206 [Cardiocondyla obscurior]|uniref:Uncharacterized protein n=1 Tax=Cardiocondyla obscurior TaxID=286306 RepID=A0AAW2EE52_9HYME
MIMRMVLCFSQKRAICSLFNYEVLFIRVCICVAQVFYLLYFVLSPLTLSLCLSLSLLADYVLQN